MMEWGQPGHCRLMWKRGPRDIGDLQVPNPVPNVGSCIAGTAAVSPVLPSLCLCQMGGRVGRISRCRVSLGSSGFSGNHCHRGCHELTVLLLPTPECWLAAYGQHTQVSGSGDWLSFESLLTFISRPCGIIVPIGQIVHISSPQRLLYDVHGHLCTLSFSSF